MRCHMAYFFRIPVAFAGVGPVNAVAYKYRFKDTGGYRYSSQGRFFIHSVKSSRLVRAAGPGVMWHDFEKNTSETALRKLIVHISCY